MVTAVVEAVYRFLWGDLFTIPLGNGNGIGIPLLVLLLIPTGVYFTIRTRFLPIRLFPDMIRALNGKKQEEGGLSPIQTLFVSTATRVGMGNLVGVVAGDLGRRRRCCVLDVAVGGAWGLHSVCGGGFSAAL